jgi:hypothetical protein
MVDVVFDLGEASAVRVLGSRVEDLVRVAECRARQAGRLAAVSQGTAATKDVEARSRLLVECVAVLDVCWWRHRRRGLDPFEDRAGRLVLQDGPVLAAAGAVGFGEGLFRARYWRSVAATAA